MKQLPILTNLLIFIQAPGYTNNDDRGSRTRPVGNLPTITEQSRNRRKKKKMGTFSRIISAIFCC